MSKIWQHPFWGSLSPLGGLTGGSLLIIASARLSWAITVAFCLLWVYILPVLLFSFLSLPKCAVFFPKTGQKAIFTCITSFFAGLYIFIYWLMCPFAALESFIPIMLVPLFCSSSGIFEKIMSMGVKNTDDIIVFASRAGTQAAVLAGLIIAISIIREPFSYCSLSFPGSYNGMIIIMYFTSGAFFPINIFAGSSGALIILGYITAIYQNLKSSIAPMEFD
jgi:hypothetical protein